MPLVYIVISWVFHGSSVDEDAKEKLAPYSALSGDESYSNRDLEKMSQQVAKRSYNEKVQPTTLLSKQVGNMYTASLYAAFASLIHEKHSALHPQGVVGGGAGDGAGPMVVFSGLDVMENQLD
ncbi:hypothetical protein Syun_011683 [Stephania yunnanensis]|uniref:Hydroxymethylglutaryl-coenzyme A synthase C-terminal domain-containing protein n=1 Tax=Stephania yunnanensis TaxID=152371 RepID=A0AAP0PEK4_9MAGN